MDKLLPCPSRHSLLARTIRSHIDAQRRAALALALGAGGAIVPNLTLADCTIAATAIASGQTAECTGTFSEQTYTVRVVTNATVINYGDWSESGNLPSTSSASVMGPNVSSINNNLTGLSITNYGNLSWTNASATNISSVANRTMAVMGTYVQNNSRGSTFINHGSITGIGGVTALNTLAGIGSVGRSGPLYAENTGSIHIDVSGLTSGYGAGMLTFAGSDVDMLNSGRITSIGGKNGVSGIEYLFVNWTGYQTGSVNIGNSGTIDASATTGDAHGIYFSVTDRPSRTLTDVNITNTGTIRVSSESGAEAGIYLESNVAAVPIRIENHGEVLSSGYAVFLNASSVPPVHILNTGLLQGDVVTRSGTDIYQQEGGTLAGGLSMGTGSDRALFTATDLSPTTLLDGGDDADDADGSIDTLTVTGVSATLSGARVVNWERIDFSDSSIVFDDGALTTGSNDALGLFLTNSSVSVGNAFALTGNLSVDAGSAFVMAGGGSGVFSVSGNMTNGGRLELSDGAAGDVLTIGGNYDSAGATIVLDTALGDDASATDRLVIQGDSSGSGLLRVNNAGGAGAQTTEGIKVIDVAGTSNAEFRLIGDYVHNGEQAVVGGAYAYKLYKNGAADPGDGDWYLRSQLIPVEPAVTPAPEPTPTPPPSSGPPPTPEPEPTPSPAPAPAAADPLYQPGAPVYEVYPRILLGLNGLPTLQQRVGNRYWTTPVAQGAAASTPSGMSGDGATAIDGNGLWVRIEGERQKLEPHASTATAEYEYGAVKVQAGLDGVLSESRRGKLFAGFTAHYAQAEATIESPHDADGGHGEVHSEGYGLGATLTWYGSNGVYLDGQAQVSWYESDLDYYGGHRLLAEGNDGFGYALSVESGRRIALDSAWSITPQAQLAWSSVDFDDFDDVFGSRVKMDRGDSLQSRLGISLEHESARRNDRGRLNRGYAYGIANVYYEFLDEPRVDVADTYFSSENGRWWGDIGLGGSWSWNDGRYTLYAEGLARTSLKHFGDSYSLKGTVGLQVKW